MSTVVATMFFAGVLVFVAATVLFYVRLYRSSVSWGFVATLMPPAGLVPYLVYIRKHAMAAVLVLVGAYTALVSGVLWLRMNPEHIPSGEGVRLRQWLAPAATDGVRYERAFPQVQVPDSGDLNGLFKGEPARWERIEWSDQLIRFSTGGPGMPRSMLQIRMPPGWVKTGESLALSVTPTDPPTPPVVELLTYVAAVSDEPFIQVFRQGYWLDLAVTDVRETALTGRIKLVLPSTYETWLVGDFSANPVGIRYINGELDRHYDSAQTLARVGTSHINAFLWRWQEGAAEVTNLRFQTSYDPVNGRGLARVRLGTLGVFDLPLEFRKDESGWYVVPDAVPMLVASLEMQAAPPAAGTSQAAVRDEQAPPTGPRSIERFEHLRHQVGLEGELHTLDGRRIRGAVVGTDGDQVRLRRVLEGNQLVVTVSESNFLKFVPL